MIARVKGQIHSGEPVRDILREIVLDQISAFGNIADSVERHWESKIRPIRTRLEEADRQGDEEGVEWHSEQWNNFETLQIQPHRSALFLGLWAFFEGNLVALNREVLNAVGRPGDPNPRADIVFKSLDSMKTHGGIDVITPGQMIQLKELRAIRNCITHSNGILAGRWNKNGEFVARQQSLPRFLKTNGLGSAQSPRLELNATFNTFTVSLLRTCLRELYKRDEEIRPDPGASWVLF